MKDWCWSWNSNTSAIWCEELTQWTNPDAGKDWRQKEKGMTEDEMVGWHHWLDAHEFEQALGVGDAHGSLCVLQFMGSQRVWHDWVTELTDGFSRSHVLMWELDRKESWALKNWCYWTVVLVKTLESPLNCKEIKPVNPKGNQSWIFIGKTDAEAPILWPPDKKSSLISKHPNAGKDSRREEKGMRWLDGKTEDEMVGWHHQLDGYEFEQVLGVGDGQGSLVYCSTRCHKESDTTEWPKWSPHSSPDFFHFAKHQTLTPLKQCLSITPAKPLAPTILLSDSMNLTILASSYKWNYRIFVPF